MKTLSQFLQKSDFTQAQLARALGVSPGHISEIVAGKKEPSLALALRLHEACGGGFDLASLSPVTKAQAKRGQK